MAQFEGGHCGSYKGYFSFDPKISNFDFKMSPILNAECYTLI